MEIEETDGNGFFEDGEDEGERRVFIILKLI